MTKPVGHRAKPGDKLRDVVTSQSWNALLDLRDQFARTQAGANIVTGPLASRDCLVEVRNDTGADLTRFAVVGLDGVTVEPSENEDEYTERHVLRADVYSGVNAARFAVVQEDIPDGEIGRAVVCGVTVAQINVKSLSHKFARAVAGDTVMLSGDSGHAKVLHVEEIGNDKLGLIAIGSGAIIDNGGEPSACCGCSPTECNYDGPLVSSSWGDIPATLEFDAGELSCCYGKAAGIHRLVWGGSSWRSNVFPCEADGGGEPSCGTALYTAISAGGCESSPGNSIATYRCQFTLTETGYGYAWVPIQNCGTCYEGGLPSGCAGTCEDASDNGKTCSVACDLIGGEEFVWQLTTNECTCDEAPTPPGTAPTFEGETATVTCPGTPDETQTPAVPCDEDGNVVEGVLFGPGVLADAQASGYWQLTGTVSWIGAKGYNNQHFPGWDFCDTEGVGWLTNPINADGTWTGIQNEPPLYTIMACPSQPCPPEGSVSARWVLSPGSGYEAARLELIVAGVVKIRYLMPAGRLFCAKCQNLMEVEQDDCVWPCEGIAQKVCVHPSVSGSGTTCEDFAAAYSFDISDTSNETDSDIWHCANQSLSEASGSWVLDLIDSEPWMPRRGDNGCRSGYPASCCTWAAPPLTPINGSCPGTCVALRRAHWTMQTCNPRVQSLGDDQNFQHYECFEQNLASPVLRLALCNVFSDAVAGADYDYGGSVFGPSIIDYRLLYWDEGCVGLGPGAVPASFNEVSDNINDVDYTYAIYSWAFSEKLPDGSLVMVNPDIPSNVAGYLPRTITLAPVPV